MIGGDGINDESNKTAPAPSVMDYLLFFKSSRCTWFQVFVVSI